MDAVDIGVTILLVVIYLAWVNYWTYQRFAQDKNRSLKGEWRIPEDVLLRWSARGGVLAAYYARSKLRHKTRKEHFSSRLRWIAVRQAFWVPCVLVLIFIANPVGIFREHEVIARVVAMMPISAP